MDRAARNARSLHRFDGGEPLTIVGPDVEKGWIKVRDVFRKEGYVPLASLSREQPLGGQKAQDTLAFATASLGALPLRQGGEQDRSRRRRGYPAPVARTPSRPRTGQKPGMRPATNMRTATSSGSGPFQPAGASSRVLT